MTTIEKALEANRTAGSAERIEVDGFVFSRFPMNQPILCIKGLMDDSIEELAMAKRKAENVQAYLTENAPGLTWTELKQKYSACDPIHPNVLGQIWIKFGAYLDRFYEHNYNGEQKKVWYLSEDDVTAIFPDDATHLIVASYFPTREDVAYLKQHGYRRTSYTRIPEFDYAYFLETEWDIRNMNGILFLGTAEEL